MRGQVRRLAGRVRDNRPWLLVPHLAAVMVVTVLIMAVWLVVYNQLWDRPAEAAERRKAVMYNVSTATTPAAGVACMYVILFVLALLAAVVLIDRPSARRPTAA